VRKENEGYIEDCTSQRAPILAECQDLVHTGDPNSRPADKMLGSVTKWLASQILV
jgi:hypothetical protein